MIDIKEKSERKEYKYGSYPANSRRIGDGEEDLKIFIKDTAIDDIKAYLSSDKSRELGGVLVGNAYLDESNNIFLVISDIVIAKYTEANLTRLTFTHNTWEDINNKIEKDFSEKSISGWFHSHPGHTVFLSTYDKFIHENFFSGDFYVAYVFDPVHNEEGFFYNKDNNLVKANSFYIYSDFGMSGDSIINTKEDTHVEKKTVKSSPSGIASLFISVICLIITAYMTFSYIELDKKVNELKDLSLKIKELKEENAKTKEKLDKYISYLEQGNDSIKSTPDSTIKYQIKPGDTLRKLAIQYYNDEGQYNLLIRQNNLKDEFDISVGQIIEIPMRR
jgi:hypothetical protein